MDGRAASSIIGAQSDGRGQPAGGSTCACDRAAKQVAFRLLLVGLFCFVLFIRSSAAVSLAELVSLCLILQADVLGLVPAAAEVFALVAQPSGQFMHDLLENNTVHVLAQHVEEEPVAHLALLDDGVDDLSLDEPESNVEEVGAHPRTDDYHETIDDDERREHAQNEKPEPQENVNLFIDDVQRKDAERVVFLHLTRSTELVKGAFGHSRKDVHHGVEAVFLIALGERYHL